MTFPIAGLSSAAPYLGVEEITAETAGGNAVASSATVVASAPTVDGPSIGEGVTEGAGSGIGPEFGLPGTQLSGLFGSMIGGTEDENGDVTSGGGFQGSSNFGNNGGVHLGGWGYAADNPDGDSGGGSDVTFSDDEGSTFSNNGDGTVSTSDVTFSDEEGSTFWSNGDGSFLGDDGTTSDVTFSDQEAGAMLNNGDGYIDQMGNANNGVSSEDAVGQFLLNVANGLGIAVGNGEEIGKAIIGEIGGAIVEKVFGPSEGNPPQSGPGQAVDGGPKVGPGPLEYPVPDGGGPIGPASTLFMPTPDGGGPVGPASTLYMPTPEGTGPTGPASLVDLPVLSALRLS